MHACLLALVFALQPQSTLPEAPAQSTLPDPWYIIEANESGRWNYSRDVDTIPAQLTSTIHVRGPWHNGEATYAVLAQPTRQQVQTALEKAKARWAQEVKGRTAAPFVQPDGTSKLPAGAVEALGLVNEQRRERGLRPYILDEGLTLGAARCAAYRAERRIGNRHTGNDFAFLPEGSVSFHAGCAAWPDGFGACFMFHNFTYAGAAYVVGPDGLRYCQLFVRD